jgi:hypothetical protein
VDGLLSKASPLGQEGIHLAANCLDPALLVGSRFHLHDHVDVAEDLGDTSFVVVGWSGLLANVLVPCGGHMIGAEMDWHVGPKHAPAASLLYQPDIIPAAHAECNAQSTKIVRKAPVSLP